MHAQRLIKIALLWFVFGVGFGIYMGIKQDFTQAHTHAHINLLGWVSLTLVALLYRAWPALEHSKLASAHFWLHNVGAVLFFAGIGSIMNGWPEQGTALAITGSNLVFVGVVCLAINVWKTLR